MSGHYEIAITLLQGEPDAHLVLADFLEEQDDPWLANRVRRMEGKAAERLGIGLGVLPQLAAIRLGCNFIEHFLESQPDVYEYRARAKASIKAVRDWTATAATTTGPVRLKQRVEDVSDRHFYQPPLYGARSLVGKAYNCLLESFSKAYSGSNRKHLLSPEETYQLHCGIRAELHQLVGFLHQESSVVMSLPLLESRLEDGRENLVLLREIAVAPCTHQISWQVDRLVRELEKLSAAKTRNLAWQK